MKQIKKKIVEGEGPTWIEHKHECGKLCLFIMIALFFIVVSANHRGVLINQFVSPTFCLCFAFTGINFRGMLQSELVNVEAQIN